VRAKRVESYDICYAEKSYKSPGRKAPSERASASGEGYGVFQAADEVSTEGVGRRNSMDAATVTGWIKRYASGSSANDPRECYVID
jgi:hypothetical protein